MFLAFRSSVIEELKAFVNWIIPGEWSVKRRESQPVAEGLQSTLLAETGGFLPINGTAVQISDWGITHS